MGVIGGLGLCLGDALRLRSATAPQGLEATADSVIHIFLPGGMAAQESFDPKRYAPVEYRGVKVGEVVRTDIDYPEIGNILDPDSRIPVLIDIEPARLGFPDDFSVLDDVDDQINELIASGLRVRSLPRIERGVTTNLRG